MANQEIRALAKAEGERLAEIIFGRRPHTIQLNKQQLASYLATMFEAGAIWAPREIARRGGIARARKLSADDRKRIALTASKAAAAKKKSKKASASRAGS